MAKRQKKKQRADDVPAPVRIVSSVIAKREGKRDAVPGVTDEDPNTGRRIEKKPKK
jgi:hypothetical protein